MRKIHSKDQESKRKKRNQLLIVIVMVFVLFGSVFGIIVNSFDNTNTSDKIKYNSISFTSSGGFWVTSVNNMNLGFTYNPVETENLSYYNGLANDYNSYFNVPVYIYSEDSTAEVEVYRNLFSLALRVQNACPADKMGGCDNENWPVKDCTNNFIIIETSDINEINQDGNCVYIRGQKEDLIKLADEFLFRTYKIK